jgi:hypothetical protein
MVFARQTNAHAKNRAAVRHDFPGEAARRSPLESEEFSTLGQANSLNDATLLRYSMGVNHLEQVEPSAFANSR